MRIGITTISAAFVGVDLRIILWTRPTSDGTINGLFAPCLLATAGIKY